MIEVDFSGVNAITYPQMATWHWQIALYIFLGGLVAGLMVFAGVIRMLKVKGFDRAITIADLFALPLIVVGLLLLLVDLANPLNFWRLFTTFQVSSPMSWGSWILLFASILLGLRMLTLLPKPGPATPTKNPLVRIWRWGYGLLYGMGEWTLARKQWVDWLTIFLGIGLGFYTGVLLSSISVARPLWNNGVLAPLFLVSGLASGGAFLCLFLPEEQHLRLVPFSMLACGVELLLLLAYIISLVYGSNSAQQAGAILMGGTFGLILWGVVVFLGLIAPVTIEAFETIRHKIPKGLDRLPPVLKLSGSVALRFVIVYAGLQSFI